MNVSLHFVITKVDGSWTSQDIVCPVEEADKTVQAMFIQLAQIGAVNKEGNKWTLVPANQIAMVELELPTIVSATPDEAAAAAKAEAAIRKIITV